MTRTRTSLRLWIVPVVLFAVLLALPAFSYLAEYESAGLVPNSPDRWTTLPVHYRINTTSAGSNILDKNLRSVVTVIGASFATWTGAPNTSITVQRDADTTATSTGSGANVVAFTCTGSNCDFTKEPETLAFTVTFPNSSGVISEADIFFNPNTCFTTDGGGTCPTPSDTPQDLQTVATHEIGHFFGLDHTGVVRAVMFPFAPDVETKLAEDDVAGISFLYPKGSQDVPTGSISGTVTLGGNGVFGAHVYAESTGSAAPFPGFNIRKSPISTFTKTDGTYNITGVPADPAGYTVAAEPVDLPLANGDIGWAGTFLRSSVQTGFTTRWH